MTSDPHDWSRAGAPQRIELRRSAAVRAAAVAFALIASVSVYTSVAPRLGAAHAVGFALASLAALMLGMLAHERRQPATIKIGPDCIAAGSRAGAVLLAGRIVGYAQWPHLFLILAVAGRDGKGRVKPLLVPADSVPADSFRELAVSARHSAR